MTTQVESTFVTREEFLAAVDELNRKVQGLYNLADRLGYSVDVPERASVPESTPDTDRPSVVESAPRVTYVGAQSSGVDYGAVAYGLTTLKQDVVDALGRSPQVERRYADAVDWFVSCFRGDASFNEAEFRRNAGV